MDAQDILAGDLVMWDGVDVLQGVLLVIHTTMPTTNPLDDPLADPPGDPLASHVDP